MKFYSYVKTNWSKPLDEDSVLHHLAMEGSTALCGTDKRHPDLYNYGDALVQNIEHSKIYICKKCYAIWEKRFKVNTKRFKDKILQKLYELGLTATYPIPIDYRMGVLGGSGRVAWENGYLGRKITRYDKDSPAYACWCAGQRLRKEKVIHNQNKINVIHIRRR